MPLRRLMLRTRRRCTTRARIGPAVARSGDRRRSPPPEADCRRQPAEVGSPSRERGTTRTSPRFQTETGQPTGDAARSIGPSDQSVGVRSASRSDAPQLQALLMAAFADMGWQRRLETRFGVPRFARAVTQLWVQDGVGDHLDECLVAVDHRDRVVGVSSTHILVPGAVGDLKYLAVAADWRGRGIGRRLVKCQLGSISRSWLAAGRDLVRPRQPPGGPLVRVLRLFSTPAVGVVRPGDSRTSARAAAFGTELRSPVHPRATA